MLGDCAVLRMPIDILVASDECECSILHIMQWSLAVLADLFSVALRMPTPCQPLLVPQSVVTKTQLVKDSFASISIFKLTVCIVNPVVSFNANKS